MRRLFVIFRRTAAPGHRPRNPFKAGMSSKAAHLGVSTWRVQARVNAVIKSVLRGPPAPMPVGSGVDPEQFNQALRWLRCPELVAFANCFKDRGVVVPAVAEGLAAEVKRRIEGTALQETRGARGGVSGSASPSLSKGKLQRSAIEPESLRDLSPQEVAAITFAYGKLVPRLPSSAYQPLFSSIAAGVKADVWDFSPLQAALVGVSLADAGMHLEEALPLLVRRVLSTLHACGVDELRYLVHACARLPANNLTHDEVLLLAERVEAAASASDVRAPRLAHIAISWLQLRAPTTAWPHYSRALQATCARLSLPLPYDAPAFRLAYPLPPAGLAHAVRALLNEGLWTEPALTPDAVRNVIGMLVRIDRNLASSGCEINLADWAEVLSSVAEFCRESRAPSGRRSRTGVAFALAESSQTSSTEELPAWAMGVLSYVARQAPERSGNPSTESVLTMLGLIQRYPPSPVVGPQFFRWCAEHLADHAGAMRDAGTRAEVVQGVLPHLPDEERVRFLKGMFGSSMGVSTPRPEAITAWPSDSGPTATKPVQQLLRAEDGHTKLPLGVSLAVERAVPGRVAPEPPVAETVSKEHGNGTPATPRARLWDQISATPVVASSHQVDDSSSVPQESLSGSLERDNKAAGAVFETAVAAQADVAAVEAMSSESVMIPKAEADAGVAPAGDIQNLRDQLQAALQRVEEIESRLQQRESEMSVSTDIQRSPEISALDSLIGLPQKISSWAGEAFHSEPDRRPQGLHPAAAPLRLRSFSFDDIRRAEASRDGSRRVRALMPADRVPMCPWPIPPK